MCGAVVNVLGVSLAVGDIFLLTSEYYICTGCVLIKFIRLNIFILAIYICILLGMSIHLRIILGVYVGDMHLFPCVLEFY